MQDTQEYNRFSWRPKIQNKKAHIGKFINHYNNNAFKTLNVLGKFARIFAVCE